MFKMYLVKLVIDGRDVFGDNYSREIDWGYTAFKWIARDEVNRLNGELDKDLCHYFNLTSNEENLLDSNFSKSVDSIGWYRLKLKDIRSMKRSIEKKYRWVINEDTIRAYFEIREVEAL